MTIAYDRVMATTSTSRRAAATKTPREDGRERLIRVGIEAFGAEPYDQVSVAAIARQAGVAEGLPFFHFDSKHGFYVEVVRRVAGEMRDIHRSAQQEAPYAALRAMVRRHIRWAQSHPYFPLTIGSAPGVDDEVRAIIDAAHEEGVQDILEILAVTRPRPVLVIALRGWTGFVDATVVSWLGSGRKVSEKRVVELCAMSLTRTIEAAKDLDAQIDIDVSRLLSPA
jgi:AcrR family transcriptional regulator